MELFIYIINKQFINNFMLNVHCIYERKTEITINKNKKADIMDIRILLKDIQLFNNRIYRMKLFTKKSGKYFDVHHVVIHEVTKQNILN